jgi:hypothetical protein
MELDLLITGLICSSNHPPLPLAVVMLATDGEVGNADRLELPD